RAASTISTQRKSDPKRLSQLFRGDLDWIVMKALDKDRNRRYETASAFAADVQRYLRDEPVQACPPSAWYRFHKFTRRNQKLLVTAAAFVLLLLAGIALTTWQAIRAGLAEGLATQRLTDVEAANAQAGTALQAAKDEKDNADRSAETARRAAATANAVKDYLVLKMLRSPDPQISLGRKVTVLEVLAEGEAQIDGAFPEQPLVEAEVRNVIRQPYDSL